VSLSPNKPQSEKILEMQSAPYTNDSRFNTSIAQKHGLTQGIILICCLQFLVALECIPFPGPPVEK